jgi:heptosyltransferase I
VIGKIEYQLVQHLAGVEFIVCDKRAKDARKQLKQAMAGRVFDVLLQMQVAFRANWLGSVIRAKRKIGFDQARSKELHGWFVNERITGPTRVHVLDGFMQFADKLGVPPQPVTWDIALPDPDCQWARETANSLGRFVVVAPAASKAQRNWLNDRYAEVIEHLYAQGIATVLCGGPGPLDQACREAIMQHTDKVALDLVGQTSLPQMAALMAHAACVIAPDTGPAHIASMMGAPVVGLYAHSNPLRTGPYRSLDSTVSVYAQAVQAEYGKMWEALAWGKRAHGDDLMAQISVCAVIEQVDACLQSA